MISSRVTVARSNVGYSKVWEQERSAMFYFGFALLYIKTFVSETTLITLTDPVDAALLLASSFFFVLHCFQRWKEFDRPAWLILAVFLFLVVNYHLTSYTTQMTAFLLIVAASFGVDLKHFVSIWFKVTGFLFLVLISFYLILYFAGSDLATSLVRSGNGSSNVRLSFFFNHPNGAATVAMMLAGAMLYLNADKTIKFSHYATVFIAALFVLYATDSRTSALLTLALIPLYLLYQKGLFNLKVVRLSVGILPIGLFTATFLLAGPFYSLSVAPLFTGRVWLWHTTLVNSGITVFGQAFVPTSAMSVYGNWESVATTLDGFYASGLLTVGLVVSGLFCWSVFRTAVYAADDETSCLPLLVVLLFHGFTEVGVLTVAIAFPVIFLSISLRFKEAAASNRVKEDCLA